MIPKHVAIIMDGNRRWAKAQGKDVLFGHRYVADELLEQLVDRAIERGISYITFWAWSTENWQRTPQEVQGIMKLFRFVLEKHIHKLMKKGVQIRVIGDYEKFPADLAKSIHKGIEDSKDNKKITAIFALNYGGRDEIVRAVNKAISEQKTEKEIVTNHYSLITENDLSRFLDTAGIPDPDLIIRTGGEQRLSGFLLWQSEYAELYFTETLMPDFTPEKLDEALEEYAQRSRRFGK